MSTRHNVATIPLPNARRPRLSIGQTVGRYTLTSVLGSGAMGVVYRAFDPILDRHVALKSLHVEDERSRQRFVNEARAMARVSHPNVVQVYDVIEVERPDGLGRQWMIAMELVEGITLETWLQKPRSWSKIRDVFAAAGKGLAAAHAAGLVHRDFKPANVLLGHDGRVCVTDFGLTLNAEERASTIDERDGAPRSMTLTYPGLVVGTPAYMSPEQHRGVQVGPSSDQFAFCATLFEALYRVRPFDGRDCRELSDQKHVGQMRPACGPRPVPGWLRRVVHRGLEIEPRDRFAGMGELVEHLERRPRARRTWQQLAAAVVLVIGGIGLGASLTAQPSVAPASTPLPSSLIGSDSGSSSASASASSLASASALASASSSSFSTSRWR